MLNNDYDIEIDARYKDMFARMIQLQNQVENVVVKQGVANLLPHRFPLARVMNAKQELVELINAFEDERAIYNSYLEENRTKSNYHQYFKNFAEAYYYVEEAYRKLIKK